MARIYELGKVMALWRILNISISFAQWKQDVFSVSLSSKSYRSYTEVSRRIAEPVLDGRYPFNER